MSTLGVDQFKSKLTGGGARANLFQVTCNFPGFAGGNSELASFMIKAASLPGSTIGGIEVPFRGRKLKIAGDRTFDQWTITIINDVPMKLRDAFERWMNGVNQHQSNVGRGNPRDYQTDWAVTQLDKSGSPVKNYIFRGVFPRTVAPIDLSYETVDAIEDFQVTVDYQYWEAITTPSSGGSGNFGSSVGVNAAVNIGGLGFGASGS
jgi:hypothetical protein